MGVDLRSFSCKGIISVAPYLLPILTAALGTSLSRGGSMGLIRAVG